MRLQKGLIMFNRTLQVKMVKTDKEDCGPPEQSNNTTFDGKAAVVCRYTERVVEKIASAVVTYLVVDTIRQVVIERAKK
jgi:hypothetical protein